VAKDPFTQYFHVLRVVLHVPSVRFRGMEYRHALVASQRMPHTVACDAAASADQTDSEAP
jgi:hypothetical protein